MSINKYLVSFFIVLTGFASAGNFDKDGNTLLEIKPISFEKNSVIPKKYAADEVNFQTDPGSSPALEISNIPEGGKFLTIYMLRKIKIPFRLPLDIIGDKDKGLHWLVVNIRIPPSAKVVDFVENDLFADGFTLKNYVGPHPQSNKGIYKYKFVAIVTKDIIPRSSLRKFLRKFNTENFVFDYLLEKRPARASFAATYKN